MDDVLSDPRSGTDCFEDHLLLKCRLFHNVQLQNFPHCFKAFSINFGVNRASPGCSHHLLLNRGLDPKEKEGFLISLRRKVEERRKGGLIALWHGTKRDAGANVSMGKDSHLGGSQGGKLKEHQP